MIRPLQRITGTNPHPTVTMNDTFDSNAVQGAEPIRGAGREEPSTPRPLRPRRVGPVMLAAGLALVSGCSLPLPQAQNDPTRFFVLSVPAANAAPAEAAASALAVRLRPVELPNYLKARPILVRRGENEVEFRDYARWGEPLEQGIARVLREELLARGAASSVDAGGLRSADAGDVKAEIGVRVLACEGTADGRVLFRAAWEIAGTAANAGPALRGEYQAADLKWTPKNEATLVASLSRAVAGLAAELSGNLAKIK